MEEKGYFEGRVAAIKELIKETAANTHRAHDAAAEGSVEKAIARAMLRTHQFYNMKMDEKLAEIEKGRPS